MRSVWIVLCWLVVACGSGGSGSGSVDVSVTTSALSSVAKVTVTVSGPGMADMTSDLVLVGSTWEGTLGGIPAGPDRVFSGIATDAGGAPLFTGASAPVEIVANQTAVVILALQSTMPPPAFGNHAPHITSLVASSASVLTGGTVNLSVTATDADGDPLTYAWSSSDGGFASATTASTVWTAPAGAGNDNLTIRVDDPLGAFDAVTLTIHVQAQPQTGSASFDINFNSYPQITNITLNPGHAIAGTTATGTVTASDADGNPLTFAWSDDCGGSWVDNVVTWPATIASSTCEIHVVADDGKGGENFGDLTVNVGDVAPTLAPIVDSTFQSATTADHDGQVALRLYAHGATGDAVVFTFATPSGTTIVSETSAATYGELVANLPSCFASAQTFAIEAVDSVTGTGVTQTFTVDASANGCNCHLALTAADNVWDVVASGGQLNYALNHQWINASSGPFDSVVSAGGTGRAIAVGGRVYYADVDGVSGTGGVYSMAPDTTSRQLLVARSQVAGLTSDGTYLYYYAQNGLHPSPFRIPLAGGTEEQIDAGLAVGIAVVHGKVFWSDNQASTVYAASVGGGAKYPAASVSDPAELGNTSDAVIIEGNGGLYWLDVDHGMVDVFAPNVGVYRFATRGDQIYFTTGNEVYRGRHHQTPEKVMTLPGAYGLSIDGDAMYVGSITNGQIWECAL